MNTDEKNKMTEQNNNAAESPAANTGATDNDAPATAPAPSTGAATAARSPFLRRIDGFFGISRAGSSFRTEIMGGLTTFMAMVYIIMVNPAIFSALGVEGDDSMYNAVYIATALSAVIGTVLMALVGKMPLALASGMGLNAFFVETLCISFGLTYANSLMLVFFEGLLFIIFTVTGLRRLLFDAIPPVVKKSLTVGIGLFIAFLGFK